MKTPRMLPAVAAACTSPTTRPVDSSEGSVSFTSIGVGVPSTTDGTKNISVVIQSTWMIAGQDVGPVKASTSRAKKRISVDAAAAPR